MNSSDKQRVREEVVKALGEACKSDNSNVAREAFEELKKIEGKVFED